MKKLIILLIFFHMSLEAYNAGILPYTKIKGKIYFLLGREAGGSSRGTWADFGGKGKGYESTKETAMREFTEETKAAFAQFIDPNVKDYKRAKQLSNQYISPRMSQPINNPGPKVFYTMYLAEVDYISPDDIKKGIYRDKEKDAFEWVDANEFSIQLSRKTAYLQDYYNSLQTKQTTRFAPSFGDKKIRRPFATYFVDPRTNAQIRRIIGLPSHGAPIEEGGWIKPGKEEEEGFWEEAYKEPYEEEEWIVTPVKTTPKPPSGKLPSRSHDYLIRSLKKTAKKLRKLKALLPSQRRAW